MDDSRNIPHGPQVGLMMRTGEYCGISIVPSIVPTTIATPNPSSTFVSTPSAVTFSSDGSWLLCNSETTNIFNWPQEHNVVVKDISWLVNLEDNLGPCLGYSLNNLQSDQSQLEFNGNCSLNNGANPSPVNRIS